MKKILCLSLAMIFATSMFAQKGLNKNTKAAKAVKSELVTYERSNAVTGNEATVIPGVQSSKSSMVSNFEGSTVLVTTKYDLQSNGNVSGRFYRTEDGKMGFTATRGIDPAGTWADRGTGYNFFNGSAWQPEPTERVEPIKTGWPQIVPYGDGEILVCHTGAVTKCYGRDVRGTGDWAEIGNLPAPDGGEYSWPRAAVSTDGTTEYLHVIASWQERAADTFTVVRYWRSADGGNTWDIECSDGLPVWGDYTEFNSDYISVSANGNTIAMVYAQIYDDMEYIISNDNGETWTHEYIYRFPYEDYFNMSIPDGDTCNVFIPTLCNAIVDDEGVVHVAFSTEYITRDYTTEAGYLARYFGVGIGGIGYWNSTMGEFERHPNFQDIFENPDITLSVDSTLSYWHLIELNQAAGSICGFRDGIYDTLFEHTRIWQWILDNQIIIEAGDKNNLETSYRAGAYGTSIYPDITMDESGTIAIVYSTYSAEAELLNGKKKLNRHIFVTEYNPATEEWTEYAPDITGDFMYSYVECIYPQFPKGNVSGSKWHVVFNADDIPGLYLDNSSESNPSLQADLTDNQMTYMAINKSTVGIEENEQEAATFLMYPNPAHQNVMLNITETSTVEVYNITGQLVKVLSNVQGNVEFNVSSFANGVYLVNVRTAKGATSTQKLIVQ